MGRPQATQISKRLAKFLATQVANSTEELAHILETSPATILRFRATGLITHQNLKKLACLTFYPSDSLDVLEVAEKTIDAEIPLSVKLFVKSSPLTYDVHLRQKSKSAVHINVLWKDTFDAIKNNVVYLRALMDVGYHQIVVIHEEEPPKLYGMSDLVKNLPQENSIGAAAVSTEELVKELCRRGFRVALDLKDS